MSRLSLASFAVLIERCIALPAPRSVSDRSSESTLSKRYGGTGRTKGHGVIVAAIIVPTLFFLAFFLMCCLPRVLRGKALPSWMESKGQRYRRRIDAERAAARNGPAQPDERPRPPLLPPNNDRNPSFMTTPTFPMPQVPLNAHVDSEHVPTPDPIILPERSAQLSDPFMHQPAVATQEERTSPTVIRPQRTGTVDSAPPPAYTLEG